MIHLSLDALRDIRDIVLAAGGLQKLAIIRVAILAQLCQGTDEAVARALLRVR